MSFAAAAVLPFALGYWAPNHIAINEQVLLKGRPFVGLQRQSTPVEDVDAFLKRIFLISKGRKAEVVGVAFRTSTGSVVFGGYQQPALDKPGDRPDTNLTLLEWNAMGGLWEDGFRDGNEATQWGGLRAVNHFHDPLAAGGGGYTGIRTSMGLEIHRKVRTGLPYVDLLRVGVSASQWAMGGSVSEPNHWSYPALLICLEKLVPQLNLWVDFRLRQA